MPETKNVLGAQCRAEFLGTFILILVGDGAVAVDVFTGALGLWGVAMLWGLGVTLGVYAVGAVSGAHLNPAVTVTMSLFRGFPRRKILPYILSQILGAVAAAATLWVFWYGFWAVKASALGVEIGREGSQKLAMVFCCFYPNPGIVGATAADLAKVSTGQAFFVEVVLTMFLLLMILALVDERSSGIPLSNRAHGGCYSRDRVAADDGCRESGARLRPAAAGLDGRFRIHCISGATRQRMVALHSRSDSRGNPRRNNLRYCSTALSPGQIAVTPSLRVRAILGLRKPVLI
jgi:glycerol uptake facilitator-like aquaporin